MSPTAVSGNVTLDGTTIRPPAAMPLPVIVADTAPPGVAETSSDAVAAPVVAGENRTWIVQLAAGASASVQPLPAMMNCDAFAPDSTADGMPDT